MLDSSMTRYAGMGNQWMDGMVTDAIQAVGVAAAEGDKGGVTLITKKVKHPQRPSQQAHKVTFGGNKTTRKYVPPLLAQHPENAPVLTRP